MNCPVCDAKLREVQKFNVEVDICPDCKGVWLDRGELEKIIEMGATDGPVQPFQQRAEPVKPRYEDDRHEHHSDDHRRDYRDGGHIQKKSKGSWLADILGGIGGED